MGNGNFALQHVTNRLRDNGLSISWRAVDEQRMPGGDGWTELIEDAATQHEMRERDFHQLTRRLHAVLRGELRHVCLILLDRNRQRTDVMVVLEEQRRAYAARVGQTIGKRRGADERS